MGGQFFNDDLKQCFSTQDGFVTDLGVAVKVFCRCDSNPYSTFSKGDCCSQPEWPVLVTGKDSEQR